MRNLKCIPSDLIENVVIYIPFSTNCVFVCTLMIKLILKNFIQNRLTKVVNLHQTSFNIQTIAWMPS